MLHLKHLLLLAVLGTVALVLAAGDSFESYPLPSSSQPIQSTYGEGMLYFRYNRVLHGFRSNTCPNTFMNA